ncbi:hypothetical protein LAZ67_4002811 [Cordylochernes scorpioides]|uniref:Integrase catalytic domain-containing protein n=1 Tax=Cordylochernes scorpioides TaxID=51811 RepID=A0ABY6KD44_9ARAC|nr:hypothetical protein LAZ67_4002811 [Cordylochernes scorpioides]
MNQPPYPCKICASHQLPNQIHFHRDCPLKNNNHPKRIYPDRNNVKHLLTSAHHPETNAKVERLNSTIINRFGHFAHEILTTQYIFSRFLVNASVTLGLETCRFSENTRHNSASSGLFEGKPFGPCFDFVSHRNGGSTNLHQVLCEKRIQGCRNFLSVAYSLRGFRHEPKTSFRVVQALQRGSGRERRQRAFREPVHINHA